MSYRYYAQCPKCLIMEGPEDSAKDITATMKAAHYLCVDTVTTEVGGMKVNTPAKSARVYMRGDVSRPFGSGYAGSCYECGFGYNEGEFICMVTVQDGAKGKAMHEGCAQEYKKRIDAEEHAGQSDAPPF